MDPLPHIEEVQKRRRRRRKSGKKGEESPGSHLLLTRIIGGALVAVALLAAFLAGRETAPDLPVQGAPVAAVTVEPPESSSLPATDDGAATQERRKAMASFDRGLELFADGKFDEATAAFEQTLEIDHSFPGVHYQLARVASARGDGLVADAQLDQSLRRGEAMAESYLLKAQLLAKDLQRRASYRWYEQAVQAAPADAEALFMWGETLRDDGKPREAIEKLKAAAVRAKGQAEEFVIRTKLDLAYVEVGDKEWLNGELRERLADENPAPEWLVAGAAHAMTLNDWSGAAKYLDEARARMNREFYAWVVADRFFNIYRTQPELAKALNPGAQSAKPSGSRREEAPSAVIAE